MGGSLIEDCWLYVSLFLFLSPEVAGYTMSRSRTLRHSSCNRTLRPLPTSRARTKRRSIGEVKKVTESTEDVKGPVVVPQKIELADIEPLEASNEAVVQVGGRRREGARD